MMSKMVSSFGTSEAPNSNYNFTSSYVMNMHSKTKDEDLKMKTKYYFTESGKYMGTKILEGNHPQMNSSTDSMEAMIMDFEHVHFLNYGWQKSNDGYLSKQHPRNSRGELIGSDGK
jgi:hypothetical protein